MYNTGRMLGVVSGVLIGLVIGVVGLVKMIISREEDA